MSYGHGPQELPSRQELQRCAVPWALQENPERYASFWGRALE